MFATALPPLPPPASSLLPMVSQSSIEIHHQPHLHHLQGRRKPANRPNSSLTLLSNDERLIVSRKLAIAMYGYSWLKPAGCTKTMLGRKEEELEREEVERQLREVELQERMALEQEDQERREELQRQAEGGEVEGVGERDLDDEVPEAEEGDDEGGEDSVDAGNNGEEDDGDEEEEDMDGDLDDEIPEADGQESSWVYDTRREPDTESDEGGRSVEPHGHGRHFSNRYPAHGQIAEQDDPATTEAMINAMLDEDELGEYEQDHDLDDDVPDMDGDMGMDMDMDADLSDDVPAANDSPGWEHTDSELEESQMDISLLPPHPSSASRNPGTTHEEIRRVSGNRMLPPSLPPPSQQSGDSHSQRQEQQNPRTAPRRNFRAMMATPGTADDISALISTGGTSTVASGVPDPTQTSVESRSPPRVNWLNPAGARRTLFSGFRGGFTSTTNNTSAATTGIAGTQPNEAQAQSRTIAGLARATVTGISSGGLFTPSPRQSQQPQQPPPSSQQQWRRRREQQQQQPEDTPAIDEEEDDQSEPEEPRSRTRSGRLLGGIQAGIDRRRRPRGRGPGQT